MWIFYGLCLLCLICYLLANNSKYFKQKFFALILSKSNSLNLSKCLEPYKRELFSTLTDMSSHDPELAAEGVGCLRIVEIGIGSGNNLKYYPPNTRLITVEPNSHFEKDFVKKLDNFPHIILEKCITGNAEDMSAIKDNTIDVVVSTHVLCSVTDVKQCLKEIKRILIPNGRFIYVEHVSYESGSLQHKIQSCIEYLWKLFNDDCRLTLETSQYIRDAEFTSVSEESVVVKELLIAIIRPHIFGIALK